MINPKETFKFLVYSRALRSMALIYMTLAFSLYLVVLHISIIDIGLVAATTMLFAIFLTFTLGAIGDRHGYRYELIISEAFAFAGALLIALSSNTVLIIVGMVIAGISGGAGGIRGAFSPGTNAIIASNFSGEKERVKKFSTITMVASLFSIFGSIMFGAITFLSRYVGIELAYRYMFLASAFMLMLSFGFLLLLKENKRPTKTTKIMKPASFNYILRIIIANSVGGIGMGIAIPLLPLWFKLFYHADPFQIGLVFGASYIITALGAYSASKISRLTSVLNIASITRSLNGVFLVAMALSPLFIMSGLFYILRAFFVGVGSPSRSTMTIKGIENEDYGTATSINGVATRVSQLSSGASGYLMDYALPLPIFVGGILQFASGIVYKLILNKKDKGGTKTSQL